MNDELPFTSADIQWQGDEPVSRHFDDVYFAKGAGQAESEHVFIDGNHLRRRWPQLSSGADFTIAETGFGTGLNFLCAARLWLAAAPETARLYYTSVEKFPLTRADLERAVTAWPLLAAEARELLAAYPPLVPGHHRRWLFEDRVCLTLIFDDAQTGLEQLAADDHPRFDRFGSAPVNAWFLDGFAPSRNPDLWTIELFALMARLSAKNATLATFTAAGAVRRGLQSQGFCVEKRPGFGAKRDMTAGVFEASAAAATPPAVGKPRSGVPWHLDRQSRPQTKHALILGAGIAGCATAAALDRHGWQVTLVDRHGEPAREASGNPQGILYPRLSPEDSPLANFARQALVHAQHGYRAYWNSGEAGRACGVVVLPQNDDDQTGLDRIAERYRAAPDLVRLLEGEALHEVAGINLAHRRGLFFPGLGWVAPRRFCRYLAGHLPLIAARVRNIEYRQQQWHLLADDGTTIAAAPALVLACGYDAVRFPITAHLPLKRIRGQITAVPETEHSRELRTVICGKGYIAPARDGVHTLGATYNLRESGLEVRQSDHAANLKTLAQTDGRLADLFADTPSSRLDGRAALRCTTPDYLPVVGPAPVREGFISDYAALNRDAKADIPQPGQYWPGLYLNCGHGSRGLTYAPMAAEWLADHMNGRIPALPRKTQLALHPARFIIRDLKRKRLTPNHLEAQ